MSSDLDFMNELDAATRMRPSFAAKMMLGSVTGLVALFIVWSSASKIEEITHGSGQVVPTQEIQIVQSLEGGVLAELMVAEGDRVEKGQTLMRISAVQFASEERGVEAQQATLQAKRERLKAEAEGKPFVISPEIAQKAPSVAANETALYASRQKELENALAILKDATSSARSQIAETQAEIKRLESSRGLLSQELGITEKMVAQKAVPQLDAIRLRRELSDISGQLNSNREKIRGLQAELSSAENQLRDQRDKFRSQALGELGEVEAQLPQLQENLASIGDRVDRAELKAPVTGIVNNLALKTIGGVVEPAQRLAEIVPLDDELKIIARVLPNDIAFLKPEQPVKVNITAYDSQRYGSLDGVLKRVGANSVTDRDGKIYFEVEVRTKESHLGPADRPLPVTPGMVADVSIITGKKSVMAYLMKPVLRLKDKALTER